MIQCVAEHYTKLLLQRDSFPLFSYTLCNFEEISKHSASIQQFIQVFIHSPIHLSIYLSFHPLGAVLVCPRPMAPPSHCYCLLPHPMAPLSHCYCLLPRPIAPLSHCYCLLLRTIAPSSVLLCSRP